MHKRLYAVEPSGSSVEANVWVFLTVSGMILPSRGDRDAMYAGLAGHHSLALVGDAAGLLRAGCYIGPRKIMVLLR